MIVPRCFPSGDNTITPPGPVAHRLPVGVDLQSVGQALACADHARRIEQDASVVDRAIRLHVEYAPDRRLFIRLRDVETLLVRGKRQAVRPGHVAREQADLSGRGTTVDPGERNLAERILPLLLQTVCGIGEIQIAVAAKHGVVGTIESFALMANGKWREIRLGIGERCIHARHAAITVLTEHQPSFRIDEEAVRSGFTTARLFAGITGWLQIEPLTLPFLPAIDGILRDVREEQIAALLDPQRTLGPVVSLGEDFDLRVRSDQTIESGVESFNAHIVRGRRLSLTSACHNGKGHQADEQEFGHVSSPEQSLKLLPDRQHRKDAKE